MIALKPVSDLPAEGEDATSPLVLAVQSDNLTFSDDGVQLFRAGLTCDQLNLLEGVLSHLQHGRAGVRLRGVEGLAPFLASSGQMVALPL
jgi:hypothetical protein